MWLHGECEGVDNELFEVYVSIETAYTCLSCRQMEDCLADITPCDSINSSLIDDGNTRDDEVKDQSEGPLLTSTQQIHFSNETQSVIPGGEPIPVITSRYNSQDTLSTEPITLQSDIQTETEPSHINTILSEEVHSENSVRGQKCNIPTSSSTKRRKTTHQKKQKSNDLDEQLSHAKTVIYSLEKEIQDKDNANKILTQELSILKRLDPTPQYSQNNTAMMQPAQHGHNSSQDFYSYSQGSHPPWSYISNASFPHTEQYYSYSQHQYEREMQMTRERLMTLELEQLKTKVSMMEAMALQTSMNNQLLYTKMANNLFMNYRHPGFFQNPYYSVNPYQLHYQTLMNRPTPVSRNTHPRHNTVHYNSYNPYVPHTVQQNNNYIPRSGTLPQAQSSFTPHSRQIPKPASLNVDSTQNVQSHQSSLDDAETELIPPTNETQNIKDKVLCNGQELIDLTTDHNPSKYQYRDPNHTATFPQEDPQMTGSDNGKSHLSISHPNIKDTNGVLAELSDVHNHSPVPTQIEKNFYVTTK